MESSPNITNEFYSFTIDDVTGLSSFIIGSFGTPIKLQPLINLDFVMIAKGDCVNCGQSSSAYYPSESAWFHNGDYDLPELEFQSLTAHKNSVTGQLAKDSLCS